MSQVDDWSDGYTSDYLRDLNTYGPASANVPRPSSVVSRRVQYQPPVAQTEAETNDTPLYSGGREDLWNIRSGQDSGWQGRAGQGSDWGSSGRSSSSRSRSQSGESGTGRSSGRSSGSGTGSSMGRSSGRSTNSRVGRSASSGTGSRSTISGADVTADVMKALKADGNTSFADWRGSLKRQGFANADSIKYDPTTGKFIDTTGGSMPSASTGTYKDASDPMSQRILANSTTDSTTDNSGAGSGRVAESVVGAAQDITDQASPYRAVAALAGADNVGSPEGASVTKTAADIQQDDLERAYDWTATGNAGTGGFSPERPMIDSSDAASGIPPEIMARLKKDADDGSPWGLLPWALGPTYKPIAGLLPAGQKLLTAGQKLLPYNGEAAAGAVGSKAGEAAAGAVGSKAGEAAAGDAAAGAGGRSFGFDLSAEDVAAANAANAAAKQQAFDLSEMRSALMRDGMPDREIEAYMHRAGFYNDPEALRQAIDVVRKYGTARLFEHSAARAGSAAGTGAGSAAGTGSRGSFRFDLSPEEIASAKASHDAYVRGTAGAADGGVSELANAGNVGRETAAGGAAARQGAGEAAAAGEQAAGREAAGAGRAGEAAGGAPATGSVPKRGEPFGDVTWNIDIAARDQATDLVTSGKYGVGPAAGWYRKQLLINDNLDGAAIDREVARFIQQFTGGAKGAAGAARGAAGAARGAPQDSVAEIANADKVGSTATRTGGSTNTAGYRRMTETEIRNQRAALSEFRTIPAGLSPLKLVAEIRSVGKKDGFADPARLAAAVHEVYGLSSDEATRLVLLIKDGAAGRGALAPLFRSADAFVATLPK